MAHVPVLVNEVLELLDVKDGGVYVDGTAGSGGHSKAMLKAAEGSFVLAIDRDTEAVERTSRRLDEFGDRVKVVQGNFSEIGAKVRANGLDRVDGILLDLGVSSEQLDVGGRGFSIRNDGPLDMRMNMEEDMSAESIVNTADAMELADIFRKYGEERRSMPVARAIVRARKNGPIRTTGELAEIVARVFGGRRSKIHPATRVFQALRIHVNKELEMLERGLVEGLGLLSPGGRFAVISYHSLEDRIVKHFFKKHAGRWESLQEGGRAWIGADPAVKLVTRKPVIPSSEEIERNSRARSAKLRVAERV
jgi:16S rRNA (cytosine1402-N4)-methyltransferase